jgi:hypothetical protein
MLRLAAKPLFPNRNCNKLYWETLMAVETSKPAPLELPPGWNVPQPEKLPEPSVWPATLALGITFLLWGLVTTLIITAVGVTLFAVALAGWIRDIRHERGRH